LEVQEISMSVIWKRGTVLLLALLLAALPLRGMAQGEALDAKHLMAGDKLEVLLYEDLTSTEEPIHIEVVVDQDGNIFLPMLGEVIAQGRTATQLEQDLKSAFSDYVSSPLVSVRVIFQRSQVAYLVGAVREQGAYPVFEGMRLSEFLAESGGIDPNTADLMAIHVLRIDGTVYRVDMDLVLDGQTPEEDLIIKPGDKIFVPQKGPSRLEQVLRVTQIVSLVLQIGIFIVVLTQ
jgi:polysaccharide export outer membrane protein